MSSHRESMLKNQDIINEDMLTQLVDLDSDEVEDFEFLRSIVDDYFEQAKEMFKDMENKLAKDDLENLGKLAHTLKGSSGQLGVRKVQDLCEKMQQYGKLRDVDGKTPLPQADAGKRIKECLERAKKAQAEAEKWLDRFLGTEEQQDEDGEGESSPTTVDAKANTRSSSPPYLKAK